LATCTFDKSRNKTVESWLRSIAQKYAVLMPGPVTFDRE
jgi:hypothetical protein